MEKKGEELEESIKRISETFLEKIKEKEVFIISHFDTDGITSAAIIIQTLKKLDTKFSMNIIKSLEEDLIKKIPKNKVILFLDLASNSLKYLKENKLEDVFIIDHHEITQEIPEKVNIINPQLNNKEKLSSSALTYLFSKQIDPENKKLVKLALLGMIGDSMEKNLGKIKSDIFENEEISIKNGLMIYPSTRPINRVLELCSDPLIPGITGNFDGVIEILRESNIKPENGKYKNLIDLTEEEMEKLTTNILLRNPKIKNKDLIGEIYLLKFFGKLEDAREMSAKINACSRFGETSTALQLCLESQNIKKRAETIHAKYKQLLISGIRKIEAFERIEGKGFLIINARREIKDTMIGTIMSILSYSPDFDNETVLIGLAQYEDKIKVSARNVGDSGINVREILEKVVKIIGGEVGGHKSASGCIIPQQKEKEFLELLQKNLETQTIHI